MRLVHRTPVVFVGQVTGVGHPEFGPFRFRIEEAFKGVPDGVAELEIDSADKDLRLLRAGARGAPIQQLQGRIAGNTEDATVGYHLRYGNGTGLAGVRLTATASNDGKTYTGATDARGSFRIEVPEPGA